MSHERVDDGSAAVRICRAGELVLAQSTQTRYDMGVIKPASRAQRVGQQGADRVCEWQVETTVRGGLWDVHGAHGGGRRRRKRGAGAQAAATLLHTQGEGLAVRWRRLGKRGARLPAGLEEEIVADARGDGQVGEGEVRREGRGRAICPSAGGEATVASAVRGTAAHGKGGGGGGGGIPPGRGGREDGSCAWFIRRGENGGAREVWGMSGGNQVVEGRKCGRNE